MHTTVSNICFGSFQFLGIPPKGEHDYQSATLVQEYDGFQFLGIPPKGELGHLLHRIALLWWRFPISRDPPEGGTAASDQEAKVAQAAQVSNF